MAPRETITPTARSQSDSDDDGDVDGTLVDSSYSENSAIASGNGLPIGRGDIDGCSETTDGGEERCKLREQHREERQQKRRVSTMLAPTTWLPLLIMIDMFAVSLVVPLLHRYYRAAGVTSARQRELLSSLYSSSQIAGGLVLGALTDGGYICRRTVLFVSFAGSAISYGLVVRGGFRELVVSRIVVGLVKQTMTVTTALMASYTTSEDRSMYMGRLSASSTVAWIVGPSAGALLYRHVDESAPAVCASLLFVLNSIIAALVLPKDDVSCGGGNKKKNMGDPPESSPSRFASFLSNLRSCFGSKYLGSAVASLLLFTWVTRATSNANMASYYEELYGIEPHQRGYLSSYQQLLNLAVQSSFVRPLLRAAGGERRAACIGAALFAAATMLELRSSVWLLVSVVCPAVAVSSSMLGLSLRSHVTEVSPKGSLGSVLAALDVLQNAANVTTPFYRAFLFAVMARYSTDDRAAMRGDPNPFVWLASSVAHWALLSIVLGYLLLGQRRIRSGSADETSRKEKDL